MMHYVDLIDKLSKRYNKFSKKRPKLLLDLYLIIMLVIFFLVVSDLSGYKTAIVFTIIFFLGLTGYLFLNNNDDLKDEYPVLDIDLTPVKYTYKTQEKILEKLYLEDKHLYRSTFYKMLRLEKLTENDYRLPWSKNHRDNSKYNKLTLIGFLFLVFNDLLPENDNSKASILIKEYFIEELHKGISISASKFRNNIDPQKDEFSNELNTFMDEVKEILKKS